MSATSLPDPAGGTDEQFRLLVDGVRDYAIVMLDPQGIVTGWNPGAERIKGYTAEEITGEHFSRFYTAEDVAVGRPGHVLRVAEREGQYEEEGWRVRKDGTRFWASLLVTALVDETGSLRGFGKLVRDVSERREAEIERDRLMAELAEAARIDDLTGLLNRRVWREELDEEMARARRYETPLTVVLLDLDRFKDVNDELGHAAGDALLKEVARRWSGELRRIDSMARFGGDEFVCTLPRCTAEEGVAILERMRLSTPEGISVSAGVAVWDLSESADALFARVDRALYRAKQDGRGRTALDGQS